ncbi:MAG: hypothetical protein K5682_06945 [Lachnospiraceae bacterium]|nr:hypothetical protein [Lachnospiraceae bacterium]
MVTLFENNRINSETRSSKGNQLKWRDDTTWYKADYTGYEGLSEYMISQLLRFSSLQDEEFVVYEPENIRYRASLFHGVKSKDFLPDGFQLITLERLFQNAYGRSLNTMIYKTENKENRLKLLVSETERVTGLKGFGSYMAKILAIDTFFLNEDRHTHNIAVLANGLGEYRLCPIFDQGAGLLADTTIDYPLTGDIYEMMASVHSKTFCDDFAEQLDIADRLYGRHIRFTFTKKDIDFLLAKVPEDIYDSSLKERVRTILYEQMRQYPNLFA